MLNLQQNRKNALGKTPQMFVNCKQSSYKVTFLSYKKLLVSFLSNWFGKYQNNYPSQVRWTVLDIYLDSSRLPFWE